MGDMQNPAWQGGACGSVDPAKISPQNNRPATSSQDSSFRQRLANRRAGRSLRAELIGTNTCDAAGLTARGYAPALVMCRELIAAGLDPETALEVYRSGTLALRIRSIGEGANLDVREDNRGAPRFVRHRPGPDERARIACGEAPPMPQNAVALGRQPSRGASLDGGAA